MQARGSRPAAMLPEPLPSSAGLADLVRGDVLPRGSSMDGAPCMEAVAQRSWCAEPSGKQPIPEDTAALPARTALSLPVRTTARARLVDPYFYRSLASATIV